MAESWDVDGFRVMTDQWHDKSYEVLVDTGLYCPGDDKEGRLEAIKEARTVIATALREAYERGYHTGCNDTADLVQYEDDES